jgi:hypothetical protein
VVMEMGRMTWEGGHIVVLGAMVGLAGGQWLLVMHGFRYELL